MQREFITLILTTLDAEQRKCQKQHNLAQKKNTSIILHKNLKNIKKNVNYIIYYIIVKERIKLMHADKNILLCDCFQSIFLRFVCH